MTYKELKEIVDKRLLMHQVSLPIDTFYVASQLNIRIKNSISAKEDFKDNNPLYSHNAVYTINKGEYTIYYDEHYTYKNFSIAHEISHHLLGHTSDGAKQHQEAQLMACIIVAPIKLIHKFKIKSPSQLSEICKIPIDAAEDYWNEITKNEGQFYSLNKSNAIKIIVIILLLAMITLPIYFNYAKRIDYTGYERNFEETTYLTPSINPTDSPPYQSISQIVYVTKTGEKYHLADCRHIKNVEYIIEFSSAEKAENAGYLPCKDCIK